MNFWRKNISEDEAQTRAEVIIKKKSRKQDPKASGLGAVAIPRNGPRAVHQRNEDRHVLRGKTARADIGGNIHEVSLLNLSSNGVMIESDLAVDIGQEIFLSIEDCAPITTAVRWLRAGRIGLEFIAETVIIAEAGVQEYIVKTIRRELEESGAASKMAVGSERRDISARHNLVFVAKLRWDAREATARLRNISRTGAMIALADPADIAVGEEVTLSLAKAGDVAARVRWASDRQFGLEFLEDFDVSLLVKEHCAELEADDDAGGLGRSKEAWSPAAEDFDVANMRLGKVENPHEAPAMRYGRLTLDEVYATLYPNGKPAGAADEAEESPEADG